MLGSEADQTDEVRKEREREFHNRTFADDSREKLNPIYRLTEHAMATFRRRLMAEAAGATVLEYGCGPGTHSFQLAGVAKRAVGNDLSEVAIDQARQRAREAGVANVEFHVMDAEDLRFPAETFDAVTGRAILHHLDLPRAFSTISRVLRPGRRALFLEPLGHNPAINLYRRLTPSLRTPDEHPLLMRDVETARRYFDAVDIEPFVLTSLAAAPMLKSGLFPWVMKGLERVDDRLFRFAPLRRYAWTSIWSIRRR